jgi:pilus assembly protein CpaE
MPTNFSIYYHSLENMEYLRQVIDNSGSGKLVVSNDLDHLPSQGVNGTDVILLEYQENNPDLDRWIETTAANPKNPAIFLYFKEISTSNLWKALRLGAKECFTFPIQEEDFQQAVQRIAIWSATKETLAKPTQIVSFLGCKGGVGTTFLVANEVRLLAKEFGERILAIDLDLGFAQLNAFFDVHPKHTMTEVVENLERMDKGYLQNIFYAFDDNCFLLPAPARLEEIELINGSHLEKIIHFLTENLGFQRILIDCCHQIDELTLKVLELSQTLVLVAAPSIPALGNAKKILEILHILGLKGLEIEVWVNFWDRQNELTLPDIENFLGTTIAGTISCDYKEVGMSINEGKLLVEAAPRHPICTDLRMLAAHIRKQETAEKANDSGWQWLQRLWKRK